MLLLQLLKADLFECPSNFRHFIVDITFLPRMSLKKAIRSYHLCLPVFCIEDIQAIVLSGSLQEQMPHRMVPSPQGLKLPSHPTYR